VRSLFAVYSTGLTDEGTRSAVDEHQRLTTNNLIRHRAGNDPLLYSHSGTDLSLFAARLTSAGAARSRMR
jgi:hypothetical protein